ncbi:hypothetical protein AGDE_05913 [Angomonas deanei]|uniref:Protein YIPF n=1 Tax=Angomonas deanei TaxID=59799 RepID=A0A7G2CFJ1_9TRYP|nr:hypothetical protein AGDE_05913 [Angomonas deanei]CAD2218299.1 Yip1 domain containing protein, putative [Angomonas deanei]|eukprot:EPY38019.1 hypothetical protein AGDE_05913 [Angomonas deanei]
MSGPYENYGSNDPFKESAGAYAPPTKPDNMQQREEQHNPNSVSVPIQVPTKSPTGGPNGEPAAAPEALKSTSKFWRSEFYQQFFDVDTNQVLLRLSNALVPLNPPDFLMDRKWHMNSANTDVQTEETTFQEAGVTLNRRPDLYGPFWICTTLWITLGIVSNIMSKIAYTKANDTTTKWTYNFQTTYIACLVIYLYCFVFATAVWGLMKWKSLPVALTDTLCLYGYSMFIFELVAVLCMVPVTALQWIFVLLGGLWSTAYLIINFWFIWKTSLEKKWFLIIVGIVSVFHILLTLSFKFYFFHYKI